MSLANMASTLATFTSSMNAVCVPAVVGDAGVARKCPGGPGRVRPGAADDRLLETGVRHERDVAAFVGGGVVRRPAAAPDVVADRVRVGDVGEAVAVVEVIVQEVEL